MSRHHRKLYHDGLRGRPWQRTRRFVLERDGYQCQLQLPGCTILATQIDHITPLSAGGAPYDHANLRASCRHCNLARGTPTSSTSRQW